MRAMSNDKPRSVYTFIFKLTSGLLTQRMVLSAIAQVKSHGTTNTIVNQSGNNLNIINVIEKGNNLFPSFSNFSVSTDSSATFSLSKKSNITTIFSQVKGGKISDINGLIKIVNNSNPLNLFLMNLAGIV